MNAELDGIPPRHPPWVLDVAHVDDVEESTRRKGSAGRQVRRAGIRLVTEEHEIPVAEHGMRTGQEIGRVEFGVRVGEAADQLWVLDAAPLHTVAHVQDHQAVPPVGEVRQAVLHEHVV